MQQRDDLLWLIKSSGRILGPFPTMKIADLLRTREISVLDEISPPLRRWQTIQYHDEFREVVDSLRKASISERTEATWSPNNTQLTQTLTDLDGGDLTDELTADLDGFTGTAKEIVVHNVDVQPTPVAPSAQARYQPQQAQNTAIQRQVEKTTRTLWVVTGLILLAAAAFIVNKRMNQPSDQPRPSGVSFKQNVINQVQIGHYPEALKDLRAAYADPLQSGDLGVYYGALLVQLEGQTLVGRRLFNNALATKRPEVKQAYTALGLADLVDGQLDAADENLNRALKMDADFVPALVNKAAVALQKGGYAEAKRLGERALKLVPGQGEAMLMVAEAQLYLSRNGANAGDFARVAKSLSDFRARYWDFAGEVGFYALYFDYLRKDTRLDDKVQAYLDTDPRLTIDHRHNMFIYRGRTQWKVLARLCEQMVENIGDDPRASALLASCYAREARWDNARRAIEKAVHQAPKDPLIQAWYSYVLRESGDADQASVVLGSATQANRRGEFILPTLLQARFCQAAGLVECARENWQRLFERDLEYLPAVAGLAWVNAEIKSRGEALKLMTKGLRTSPEYIPLLELRQRAEGEGWYVAN